MERITAADAAAETREEMAYRLASVAQDVNVADVTAETRLYVALPLARAAQGVNVADVIAEPRRAVACELARVAEDCHLAESDGYVLTVVPRADGRVHVVAGCRYFATVDDAIAHWSRPRRKDDRARIFRKALIRYRDRGAIEA